MYNLSRRILFDARLEEMERFFEAEKQRKAQASDTVSYEKGEVLIPEGSVYLNNLLYIIKFVIGTIVSGYVGYNISLYLHYFMSKAN